MRFSILDPVCAVDLIEVMHDSWEGEDECERQLAHWLFHRMRDAFVYLYRRKERESRRHHALQFLSHTSS